MDGRETGCDEIIYLTYLIIIASGNAEQEVVSVNKSKTVSLQVSVHHFVKRSMKFLERKH